MARKSLPKGVTYDEGAQRYRVQYKNADGRWRVEHAGTNKQAAVRLLARRKREAAKCVQAARDAHGRGDVLGVVIPAEYDPAALRPVPVRAKINEITNFGAKVAF